MTSDTPFKAVDTLEALDHHECDRRWPYGAVSRGHLSGARAWTEAAKVLRNLTIIKDRPAPPRYEGTVRVMSRDSARPKAVS